jgi:hypothetical protein
MKKKNSHTDAEKKFKRSIEEHIQYYRNKSMREKLLDAIMLSDLCIKLAEARNKIKCNGK